MEIMSPSSSVMFNEQEAENFDELAMQESLLFSDSLNDLKNLRSQLYSAAEYFEISYNTDDHKQFVVGTLRDYAVKALVNTVDHLGSVSFKVNGFLDNNVDEVSDAELRVSCIEQRIRTCQELVDHEGLCQQSLVIKAPKYHKRYTLKVGESMSHCGSYAVPNKQESRTKKYSKPTESRPAVRPTIKYEPPALRKTRSISRTSSSRARSISPRKMRSPSPLKRSGKYSNTEKRAVSPLPVQNRFARSGSLAMRPTLHNSASSIRQQYPSSPQKSSSMRLHAERNYRKDNEQNHSKGKNLLKSLLRRRKSKKDDTLYEYLNEY